VQRHRNTIVDCVKDSDVSIRRRALDLVYALVNESNITTLTKELIDYLTVSDLEFKADLTNKICELVQRYAPSRRYHIDTLLAVLKQVSEGLWLATCYLCRVRTWRKIRHRDHRKAWLAAAAAVWVLCGPSSVFRAERKQAAYSSIQLPLGRFTGSEYHLLTAGAHPTPTGGRAPEGRAGARVCGAGDQHARADRIRHARAVPRHV
jgi:hypothetical protein